MSVIEKNRILILILDIPLLGAKNNINHSKRNMPSDIEKETLKFHPDSTIEQQCAISLTMNLIVMRLI